jgi:hypothetical protein
MNVEARQDTDRLAYIYNTYIAPTLTPIGRLLDHCADRGRTRPISLRAFHFLLAHGGAAPSRSPRSPATSTTPTRSTPTPSPTTPSWSRT